MGCQLPQHYDFNQLFVPTLNKLSRTSGIAKCAMILYEQDSTAVRSAMPPITPKD